MNFNSRDNPSIIQFFNAIFEDNDFNIAKKNIPPRKHGLLFFLTNSQTHKMITYDSGLYVIKRIENNNKHEFNFIKV